MLPRTLVRWFYGCVRLHRRCPLRRSGKRPWAIPNRARRRLPSAAPTSDAGTIFIDLTKGDAPTAMPDNSISAPTKTPRARHIDLSNGAALPAMGETEDETAAEIDRITITADRLDDPYEETNRGRFRTHVGLHRYVIDPAERVYIYVVPEPARAGVHNFLTNLETPSVLANDLFQGKMDRAGDTLSRFVVNSTLGIFGIFDVAGRAGIPYRDDDFGATLATYGVGDYPYLLVPVIGPSNPRDLSGKVVDIFLNPLHFFTLPGGIFTSIGQSGLHEVDKRSDEVGELDDLSRSAPDPYAAERSMALERRRAELGKYAPCRACRRVPGRFGTANKKTFARCIRRAKSTGSVRAGARRKRASGKFCHPGRAAVCREGKGIHFVKIQHLLSPKEPAFARAGPRARIARQTALVPCDRTPHWELIERPILPFVSTPRGFWAAIRRWCCMAAATPASRPRKRICWARSVEVICVKGSGWDMGDIEPPGLPAVKLAPLRRLLALPRLSDEDMVNYQRIHLLDSAAPNPSVETLLHAFLPHKFVDHTHSTAVLALTDQPDGEKIARETFGSRMAYVPYTIPGFALAKSVAEIYDANRDVQGLILLRHGIFTFAEDARTAYELMIEMVTLAEERIRRGKNPSCPRSCRPRLRRWLRSRPFCAGAVALENNPKAGTAKRQILCFRSGAKILDYVNGAELARYSQVGVATPDHTIRTKNWPLIVPAPEAEKLDAWAASVRQAVEGFVARYHAYFARNNQRVNGVKKELDPYPRVILVPGMGLFGLGASAKDAAIAADIAENTVDVVSAAEAMSRYESIPEGRSVRRRILVAGTGQARQGRREAAGASGRPDHRRRFGIGAATAKAMARRARKSPCSTATRKRRKRSPNRSAAPRSLLPAM